MLTGEYDLEFEKIFKEIDRVKSKKVIIQLPDGLKQYADKIQEEIKKRFPGIQLLFWAGSCYGACDAPIHVRQLGFDLLIQLGHAPWRY